MKTFFYMGLNRENKGGVSWKIWKIERQGNRVTTRWGRAVIVTHKAVPKGRFQSKSWSFRTEAAAQEYERKRIRGKLAKGYERSPRPRP